MKRFRPDYLTIAPGAYLSIAAMLLIFPPVWMLSMFLAASVHELFHWIAVWLCGGKVLGFTIDAGGIRMDIGPMPPGRELICALAGPLGSAAAACFIHGLPLIGLCALAQGIFNLLPVYPLDGGRAIRCLLLMLFPVGRAEMLSRIIGDILLLCLLIFGVWCMLFRSAGILPVLFPIFLWARTTEKPPRRYGHGGFDQS